MGMAENYFGGTATRDMGICSECNKPIRYGDEYEMRTLGACSKHPIRVPVHKACKARIDRASFDNFRAQYEPESKELVIEKNTLEARIGVDDDGTPYLQITGGGSEFVLPSLMLDNKSPLVVSGKPAKGSFLGVLRLSVKPLRFNGEASND